MRFSKSLMSAAPATASHAPLLAQAGVTRPDEVLGRLRADPVTRLMPVILLTARDE